MVDMKSEIQSEEKQDKFWEKPLADLNEREWELLCDGCGRCCLKKFADADSDEVIYTRIVCRYFEQDNHSCSCYDDRTKLVPECLDVKKMEIQSVNWMPDTCAYRLRFQHKPLFDWHPLLAGSREKMDQAGITVSGRIVSEEYVHPEGFEEHIIRWVKA